MLICNHTSLNAEGTETSKIRSINKKIAKIINILIRHTSPLKKD